MWQYEKKLQYPVNIKTPNPKLAKIIISQLGGPDGELAASLRYLNQRYVMPYNEVKGLLTDIGTEELAHVEMISAILYQLTKNLTIDEIKPTDKEAYFHNISNDKEVLENFMCTYVEDIKNFDFSKYLDRDDLFAIREQSTGSLIGIISLFLDNPREVEIGYGLGRKYWGYGYATEAVKEIIKYLFKTEKYDVIFASYFINNLASKRVMEKAGMVYSHTVLKEVTYLDKERDTIYYKITKDSYKE